MAGPLSRSAARPAGLLIGRDDAGRSLVRATRR
jgi:hypothetical protein